MIDMKTFKIQFEKKYIVLAYVALVLCIAMFVFHLIRLINGEQIKDYYDMITYFLIFALTVFTPILLLSVIYNSSYIVENGKLITKYGFIKSSYEISKITSVIYNAEKKQCALYFGEEFMNFAVNKSWKDEFISALQESNKKIIYNETDPEEIKKMDKDKK